MQGLHPIFGRFRGKVRNISASNFPILHHICAILAKIFAGYFATDLGKFCATLERVRERFLFFRGFFLFISTFAQIWRNFAKFCENFQ